MTQEFVKNNCTGPRWLTTYLASSVTLSDTSPTVNLCLYDGVSHPPQCCEYVEQVKPVRVRLPQQQGDHRTSMHQERCITKTKVYRHVPGKVKWTHTGVELLINLI